jgi:hypothetical protein
MLPASSAYYHKLIEYSQTGTESAVEEWLMKKYEGVLLRVNRAKKEDLKLVCPSRTAFLLDIHASFSPTIYWATNVSTFSSNLQTSQTC